MLKKLSLAGAALVMTATAVIPAAPAMAQSRAYRDAYNQGYNRDGYDQRYYDNGRTYRGYDQRYRDNYRTPRECKTERGTIIGAVAGGLLGNLIAGRGDRLLGTVIGGAGGALAGREVAKSGQPGYCRR